MTVTSPEEGFCLSGPQVQGNICSRTRLRLTVVISASRTLIPVHSNRSVVWGTRVTDRQQENRRECPFLTEMIETNNSHCLWCPEEVSFNIANCVSHRLDREWKSQVCVNCMCDNAPGIQLDVLWLHMKVHYRFHYRQSSTVFKFHKLIKNLEAFFFLPQRSSKFATTGYVYS